MREVRDRISRAAESSGRDPSAITLVAVTKTVDVPAMQEAIEAGVTDVGENYVQDAVAKHDSLGGSVRWHMIGHLQKNKVKHAVTMFDLIQSVDSVGLAQEIGRRSAALGKVSDVLVEVSVSCEPSKFGARPDEALLAV
jgi:PLP dependent protein